MPLAWIPRRLTITRLCTRSNNSSNSSNFNNIPPSCIWLITCNTTINCKSFREIVDRGIDFRRLHVSEMEKPRRTLFTMRRNDDSPTSFAAFFLSRVATDISARYALSVLSLELFTNFVTRRQGTGRAAFVFVAQGPVVPSFLKPYNLFPPPRRRV